MRYKSHMCMVSMGLKRKGISLQEGEEKHKNPKPEHEKLRMKTYSYGVTGLHRGLACSETALQARI